MLLSILQEEDEVESGPPQPQPRYGSSDEEDDQDEVDASSLEVRKLNLANFVDKQQVPYITYQWLFRN